MQNQHIHEQPRPSKVTAHIHSMLAATLPYILIFILWAIIAYLVTAVRGVPFPSPGSTVARLVSLLQGEEFLNNSIYGHLAGSLFHWMVGFLLACGVGICFGMVMGTTLVVRRLVLPIVYMMQTIPSLAWVPVAILLLGLGSSATIFIIFLAGVFAMTISVTTGVRSVDAIYLKAAQMMGATNWQIFWRVLVPGSLPHVLSGLRIALANGWRALIAAEMVAGDATGLGYAIFQARWNFDYPSAFACIILIALIGLVVEALFSSIERRTVDLWGVKLGGRS